MAEENNPTPEGVAADNPVTEPVKAQDGTVQQDGNTGEASTQNGQTASSAESFTNVDPNSLAPELKESYNNMLRDYKRKTAEIADKRRSIQEVEEKANRFDQISSDEAFVKFYNGYGKETPSSPDAESSTVDDEEDFTKAFESRENFAKYVQKINGTLKEQLEVTQKDLQVQKADRLISSFKSRAGNEDFESLNRDGLVTGYVQLNRPKSEAEWEKTLTSARDYARKIYGSARQEGKREALGTIEKKVESSSEVPTESPSQIYSGTAPKELSAREAMELARKGIKVPQTW